MGSQSKLQPYKYSLRTVAASETASGLVCLSRFYMYMQPPKDALTIERLFCHFVMQFDSGVAVADRKILSVGIVDELPPITINTTSNYQRRQEVNLQADSDRRVDLSIDLTHLLKKDNVAYEEVGFDGGPDNGFTAVEILLPSGVPQTTGVVELWKLDGLFTTIGIR